MQESIARLTRIAHASGTGTLRTDRGKRVPSPRRLVSLVQLTGEIGTHLCSLRQLSFYYFFAAGIHEARHHRQQEASPAKVSTS